MMAIIGFAVGFIGYTLYMGIDKLSSIRFQAIHAALDLREQSSFGAIFLAILVGRKFTKRQMSTIYAAPISPP